MLAPTLIALTARAAGLSDALVRVIVAHDPRTDATLRSAINLACDVRDVSGTPPLLSALLTAGTSRTDLLAMLEGRLNADWRLPHGASCDLIAQLNGATRDEPDHVRDHYGNITSAPSNATAAGLDAALQALPGADGA
jgi:hypothetical protein